jgi:hypothetical protein
MNPDLQENNAMHTADELLPRPWYRQFWPWFLISIPLATIIASIVTINLAIDSDDGLVVDNYYKKGLAIHLDADALQRARDLGVEADIRILQAQHLLDLHLKTRSQQAQGRLQIALRHPTQANHDLLLDLVPAGPHHYRAELPADMVRVNWVIQLSAPESGWQLHGRINNKADEAHLLLR